MKNFNSIRKFFVILLGTVMLATSLSTVGVDAAAKPVQLKKSTITLNVTTQGDKITYGSAKIRLTKSEGVKFLNKTYKSQDKKIAKVNKDGKVTAVNKGKTVINVTVRFKKNNKKKTTTLKQKVVVNNRFLYVHDPKDQELAMADVIVDKNAVYGFSPNPQSSRLGPYAQYDWSDEALIAKSKADREVYHKSIESMYTMLDKMTGEGKSTEEIARALSTERNRIRLDSYKDDPEGLKLLKESNLKEYGNENGGTPEYFFEKYGSWEKVIEKSFSVNIGMDVCLGLYDTYYDKYIEMGIFK